MSRYEDLFRLQGELHTVLHGNLVCREKDNPCNTKLVEFAASVKAGEYAYSTEEEYLKKMNEAMADQQRCFDSEMVVQTMMRMLSGSIDAMWLWRDPVDCIVDAMLKVPYVNDISNRQRASLADLVRNLLDTYLEMIKPYCDKVKPDYPGELCSKSAEVEEEWEPEFDLDDEYEEDDVPVD